MGRIFIVILCIFCGFLSVSAQNDSIKTEGVKNKKAVYGSARKASIMSAILPGLGQIYNRKYWKAPVIYAGLGGLGYFFYINNTRYNNYRNGLLYAVNNGDVAVVDGQAYTTSQLQTQKLYYRKFRDFAVIGMGVLYILNIIDANVDAHLKTFDVSDDLSLQIDPWQGIYRTSSGYATAAGISLKFNFK
ncbi:MAG: hypothetical protein JWO32_2130 [Bacteroidetes bacterium]|nr:hypothetical protein [Bacteroidota bacterium]